MHSARADFGRIPIHLAVTNGVWRRKELREFRYIHNMYYVKLGAELGRGTA